MLDKINLQLKHVLYHNSILILPLQREALFGFCLESETDSRISCGEESGRSAGVTVSRDQEKLGFKNTPQQIKDSFHRRAPAPLRLETSCCPPAEGLQLQTREI